MTGEGKEEGMPARGTVCTTFHLSDQARNILDSSPGPACSVHLSSPLLPAIHTVFTLAFSIHLLGPQITATASQPSQSYCPPLLGPPCSPRSPPPILYSSAMAPPLLLESWSNGIHMFTCSPLPWTDRHTGRPALRALSPRLQCPAWWLGQSRLKGWCQTE